MVDQLLPVVSNVNGVTAKRESGEGNRSPSLAESDSSQSVVHAVVESPHPYLPNSVHSVVCGFEKEVGRCHLNAFDELYLN